MTTASEKTVLSVGQCAADNYAINQFLLSGLGVQVIEADNAAEALERLRSHSADLVLVNRIFDVDGESGLNFISRLKAEPDLAGTAVMLVSNHADAQEQAVARGALKGFGKAQLRDGKTMQLLKEVL